MQPAPFCHLASTLSAPLSMIIVASMLLCACAGTVDSDLLDAERAIEALRLSLAIQQALAKGTAVTL